MRHVQEKQVVTCPRAIEKKTQFFCHPWDATLRGNITESSLHLRVHSHFPHAKWCVLAYSCQFFHTIICGAGTVWCAFQLLILSFLTLFDVYKEILQSCLHSSEVTCRVIRRRKVQHGCIFSHCGVQGERKTMNFYVPLRWLTFFSRLDKHWLLHIVWKSS